MDCCKAISIAARYNGDAWNDFWMHSGVFDFEPLPLGVIVTVAGTGSECNGGAVITNEEVKIKTGRDYPKCNPKFALLDPTYTYSVPKQQMISGGFDILSHIMETYFSEPDDDNVSDDISEALMLQRNTQSALLRLKIRRYTARSNLMWMRQWRKTVLSNWVSALTLNATRWSISWEHIQTVTTALGWLYFIQYITAIFVRRASQNLPVLPLRFGELKQKTNPKQSWQTPESPPLPILLKKSDCRQRFGNWVLQSRQILKKLPIHAILYQAAIKNNARRNS